MEFKGKNRRPARAILSIGCSLCLGSIALLGQETANVEQRNATAAEIRALFQLAVTKPFKSHFVADLELIQPAATQADVANAVQTQNDFMSARDKRLPPATLRETLVMRSNILARSMSGKRLQHVEEWYSGYNSRLDVTDEALVQSTNAFKNAWGSYHLSYVNLHGQSSAPYSSMFANHELRDVLVTKNPSTNFRLPNDLWRAVGLDQPLIFEIIVSLIDYSSIDTNVLEQLSMAHKDTLLNTFQPDDTKVRLLEAGRHPLCKLSVVDSYIDGSPVKQFTLRGQFAAEDKPLPLSSIETTYCIASRGGRQVCLQAAKTNHTLHRSFFSQRAEFDQYGYPHKWAAVTVQDGILKEFRANLKVIELEPPFVEEDIFLSRFPSNYTVSEITSGNAVMLQQGQVDPKGGQLMTLSRRKQFWILSALSIILIAPFVIWIGWRRGRVGNGSETGQSGGITRN